MRFDPTPRAGRGKRSRARGKPGGIKRGAAMLVMRTRYSVRTASRTNGTNKCEPERFQLLPNRFVQVLATLSSRTVPRPSFVCGHGFKVRCGHCMARCCVTTLLAHFLLLAGQLLAVSAAETAFLSSADAPASRNGQHSTAVHQVVVPSEQVESERRHGMTPSIIAPAAAAGTSSSAVAAAVTRSFRSSKRHHWWLYSGTCSRRSGSAGLRALSFLSPALAPGAREAITGVALPAGEPGRSGFARPPLGQGSRRRWVYSVMIGRQVF